MSEPEDLLAEGALAATRLARELWGRRAAGARGERPRLTNLRRRLELLVAAVFPDAPEIGTAEAPAPLSFLTRLARRRSGPVTARSALSSTDGRRIRLPRDLDELAPDDVPLQYRLLALEQGARAARGTPAALPVDDLLIRDLFLLSEAAAVDRLLVKLLPGLGPAFRHTRADALARRRAPRRLTPAERELERLARALLAADPARPPADLGAAGTPAASVDWARARARQLAQLGGAYRGVAPVPLWGTVAPPPEGSAASGANADLPRASPARGRTRMLPRRPRVRQAPDDEDDQRAGTWMVRADDPQEKVEDPGGLQRPSDRDRAADPGALADALSELPSTRLVRTPDPPAEVLASDDPFDPAAGGEGERQGGSIIYPEWDWRLRAYRLRGAVVRERAGAAADDEWASAALRRHATLVRAVRRDFERLRLRRATFRRQPDGADVDIDAYVAAHADSLGGGPVEDRLYLHGRRIRRDHAITLLVDASASTDAWVAGYYRIVDVEKEALLVVCEALTALGDPYAVLAFSGEGPGHVEVRVLKRFGETGGTSLVRRRIAALEPEGYTRAGAALRHATLGLVRAPARHRVLLLLSDGRPNDVDLYEGRYGVEDTRMAVVEARAQGVACFCLTVDRQAPRYAARIFGPTQFAVLSRTERLPGVLSDVLRRLIRR